MGEELFVGPLFPSFGNGRLDSFPDAEEFATGFVRDLSDRNLKTLVAQIHTSVGQTVEVKPENGLLEALKKYR